MAESTINILIPATEALVGTFRQSFDPAAAVGMPAHVTLLYPFKSPSELTPALEGTLAGLFSGFPRFEVTFADTGRFPNALYLAPQPDQPFKELVGLLTRRFPENPPYGGAFAGFVPHLTIAQIPEVDKLEHVAAEFERAAAGRLPIAASVSAVTLMHNGSGRWRVQSHFELGD